MHFSTTLVWRRLACLTRLLAVLAAVAGQMCGGAAGTVVQAAETPQAALDAAMMFCQAGHAKGKSPLPPLQHGVTDQAILRVAVNAMQAAAIPIAEPSVPAASMARGDAYCLPKARAPPARHAVAAYPRGPPSLT